MLQQQGNKGDQLSQMEIKPSLKIQFLARDLEALRKNATTDVVKQTNRLFEVSEKGMAQLSELMRSQQKERAQIQGNSLNPLEQMRNELQQLKKAEMQKQNRHKELIRPRNLHGVADKCQKRRLHTKCVFHLSRLLRLVKLS